MQGDVKLIRRTYSPIDIVNKMFTKNNVKTLAQSLKRDFDKKMLTINSMSKR